MTTWEVIKSLFKNIGLYQKKFIVFLLLVVVGLSAAVIWQRNNNIQAIGQPIAYTGNIANEAKLDIVVSKQGEVTVNTEKKSKAISYLKDYDELNIIAINEPGQYISSFQGTVHLPEPIQESKVRQIVYAIHGVGSFDSYIQDPVTLIYQADNIPAQAKVTIIARFPKGYLTPSKVQFLKYMIEGMPIKIWLYIAIILPVVTIILMAYMIIKRRMDQIVPVRGIVGQPPSNAPPALVGVLIDGSVGAREIAATLIDLARRGYIFIINKGQGEFSFGIRRTGDPESMPGLALFEKALLSKIFLPKTFKSTTSDIDMRIGRHIFSRKIAQFYLDLYNHATKDGYFIKNPAKVHLAFKYAGIVLFFISFLGFLFGAVTSADPKFGLVFWVGGMAAASVVIKLSPFMPARTPFGTNELRKWLAYRRYMTSKELVESSEIIQNTFEKYLPFAIILGAEIEWVKKFGEERFTKPGWYESPECAVSIESFAGELLPLIGYVAKNLARSHEPTVE